MDFAYQRHFGMRKITSTTPFSSAPSPAISSSPMKTGPRIPWNSQSHGARGIAGVQNRNTISKDKIQGEEQRMADLLAQHGNKVMRTQYIALSVEPMDSDSNSDMADAVSPAAISAAMKKLDNISDDFHSNWLPLCRKYIESPPKDDRKRDEKHEELSISVMQQIILKLDSVETEGVHEVRQRRKDLIRRVQEVLKQLDTAKAS
ncbi:BAG domain-containing protein [Trichoderma breve]|uniref:BAG domain-containing protein n=1 Tax=Trichoderma breve TaxID=2034170 RepID=A0A9W9B6W7_9HYPO|nr:BAG domain-containing protein [Trichoderma breve]KAJ4854895.1 BAG domain-containing protein [Trichoderma breve]